MSDNVEALIAEARSDEPTDWRALAWHLADALEESVRERDALAATLERVREVVAHPDFVSYYADNSDRDYPLPEFDLTEALDSAPVVARPLPDREALIEVAEGVDIIREKGETRTYPTRILDAVLAAIEKGGESNE